jgi:hypothetical protein
MQAHRIETLEDVRFVLGGSAFHRVSIYARAETSPPERHASELRLRSGFDRAAARLRERGVREGDVEARMEKLSGLLPPLESLHPSVRTLVWLGDDQGWAWAPLPDELAERVVVASQFALRPLVRALSRDRRFRVLVVSPNRVAAFAGDRRGLHELAVEGLPATLEDALGDRVEGEGVQHHSDRPVPGRPSNAPVYHGHGGAPEEREVDRERFHRVLARAVEAAWSGDDVPTVLAAEVRTASELRQHLRIPGLLSEEVRGNLDAAKREEIHGHAWRVVSGAIASEDVRLAEAYERARHAGKTVEQEFDAVGAAAVAGRVRRLWVGEGARVAGRFDEREGRVVPTDDPAEDALDGLVACVLRLGGEVRVVDEGEAPAAGSYCAELR